MKTPHVIFLYNQDKDMDNINIGLQTVKKGRNPDQEIKQILKNYGNNVSDENIKEYLDKRWENKNQIIQLAVKQLQEYWDSIEEKFFLHLANRMQLKSFFDIKEINGYFSSRYGSGYNADKNWVAVSLHNGTMRNTLTAMHEIMHIFFHKQWWNFCRKQGLSEKNIWDVKEAVTVLLNLWSKNQIIDIDLGYEEHTELRRLIIKWFLETRDFKEVFLRACDYMKVNPEKSPNWVSN